MIPDRKAMDNHTRYTHIQEKKQHKVLLQKIKNKTKQSITPEANERITVLFLMLNQIYLEMILMCHVRWSSLI